MRRIGVEEAAAIRAQQLDGFLGGHRPHGQGLRAGDGGVRERAAFGVQRRLALCVQAGLVVMHGFDRLNFLVRAEVLDHALTDQRQRQHQGQRQQHIERAADHIGPEVAHGGRAMPGQPADQREQHGDAGGGRDEVLHRQRQHLRQVAHRRLAAIALPVGIGDETDGRVQGGVRRHRAHAGGVQGQQALHALQGVDRNDADDVEGQHGQGISLPAHLGLGVDTRQTVDATLYGAAPGGQPGMPVFHGDADVAPKEGRDRKQDRQVQTQQPEEFGGHQNFSGLNSATSR
ncbi:hypothetical protein D3C71_1136430 [compost metagenome]